MRNSFTVLFSMCVWLMICGLNVKGACAQSTKGQTSLNIMAKEYLLKNPEVWYLGKPEWGGMDFRDKDGKPIPGFVNPSLIKGAGPLGTVFPPTPAAAMGFPTESKVMEGMYYANIGGTGGFNGWENSDLKAFTQQVQAGNMMAKTIQYPLNAADQAKAAVMGQGDAIANAMGEVAKAQAASAIDYSSKFLQNFTADGANKWNRIRNELFVPIGILLLLPGVVLTQMRALVSAGNPVIGDSSSPFEGILRAMIAIFLIPGSYLVVNYGIDFSNCVTYTIASEYERIFGTSMYKDALCAEIKAFPVKGPKENQNTGTAINWQQSTVTNQADFEKNFLDNKIDDPCTNTYDPELEKSDEAMPSGAIAARFMSFTANAGLTATWNILCAFQMAYLFYLFFVGPVVAGLWVWPIKAFREAFPNWVEGVCTLCFWSLFWNTTVMLMACFKGVDDTGTIIMSALNFLATASVKYAFDFAGLVKAAGAEATKNAANGGAAGAGGVGSAGGALAAGGSSKSIGEQNAITGATQGNPSPLAASSALPGAKEFKAGVQHGTFSQQKLSAKSLPGLTQSALFSKGGPGNSNSIPHVSVPPLSVGNHVSFNTSARKLANIDTAFDAPGANAIGVQTSSGLMFLSKDGSHLFVPNKEGGYDSHILQSNQKAETLLLADGTTLYAVQKVSGDGNIVSHLSLSNGEPGSDETFSIQLNVNGEAAIQQYDDENNLVGSTSVSEEGDATIYSTFEPNGNLSQTDKVVGNTVSSTFYDATQKGKVLGSSQTIFNSSTGSSSTTYFGASGQIIAISDRRSTPTGYVDTVSNSAGQVISTQQKSSDAVGNYKITDTTYASDNSLANIAIANYDFVGTYSGGSLTTYSSGQQSSFQVFEKGQNAQYTPIAPSTQYTTNVLANVLSRASGSTSRGEKLKNILFSTPTNEDLVLKDVWG